MNLANQSTLTPGDFIVTIDSFWVPSFDELREKYELNPLFWSEGGYKRFEVHEALREIEPIMGEVIVCARRLPRHWHINMKNALQWSRDNGYRFLFPWEREALSDRYTHNELFKSIDGFTSGGLVDLGTVDIWEGCHHKGITVALRGADYHRYKLDPSCYWDKDTLFLFAKIAPSE